MDTKFVNAYKITNFKQDRYQLEASILFWIAAAGHNGVTSAAAVNKFLKLSFDEYELDNGPIGKIKPFLFIRNLGLKKTSEFMRSSGIGCCSEKNKAGTYWNLANSGIDLKTCTRQDLLKFKGIGLKTASCFLLHSRDNQKIAGLDRHILRLLKKRGYDNVPDSTPGNPKIYESLERVVVDYIIPESGLSPAEFDLSSWVSERESQAEA